MAKQLNDTQRLILASAAARDDLRALPLPDTLRAPAHTIRKMVAAMITQGLLGEITALPDDAVWTESNAGGRVALIITPTGLAAIGIEPGAAPAAAPPDTSSMEGKVRRRGARQPAAQAATGDGGAKQSKQDLVLAMLRRPQGASVPEMVAATGWQAHSVRGFLSGPVKKRLGLEVTSAKSERGERRYRVSR